MYTVTVHHHDKNWRRGNLEDKLELIESKNFKTRKAAKEWIGNQIIRGPGRIQFNWHKGDTPSYCYRFTGVTWQHENSGEEMEEYYQYTLKKARIY